MKPMVIPPEGEETEYGSGLSLGGCDVLAREGVEVVERDVEWDPGDRSSRLCRVCLLPVEEFALRGSGLHWPLRPQASATECCVERCAGGAPFLLENESPASAGLSRVGGTGSNRRHPACKAGALPAELTARVPHRRPASREGGILDSDALRGGERTVSEGGGASPETRR